jgi:ribosomal-protein-alanine N-acetyltransferase
MTALVRVRAMALNDIDRVAEIDRTSFTLPWPERSFKFEITENEASRPWVVEIRHEQQTVIAGMLVIWMILDEAHIGTIAVHPQYRGSGLGQYLLASALVQAAQDGARISFLEVRRSNAAAQKMYEKFGYQLTSVRARYYRDNNEDALLMTLDPLETDRLQELAVIPHNYALLLKGDS